MEEATVMFLAATTLIITSLREWRGEVVTSGVLALAMHPLLEVVVATPAVTTTGVMGVDKTVATGDALQLTTSVEPSQVRHSMERAQHLWLHSFTAKYFTLPWHNLVDESTSANVAVQKEASCTILLFIYRASKGL